jgi:hypothetical protein
LLLYLLGSRRAILEIAADPTKTAKRPKKVPVNDAKGF